MLRVRGHAEQDIAQVVDAVQLVDSEDCVRVVGLRHIDKRQRTEIVPHERDVGRESRHALVHVFEWLEIRELHHREKRLFKWIGDGRGSSQNLIEALLDHRRHFRGEIHRSADPDRVSAQPPARGWFRQQIF